ncbi:MAG: peptidoglycan-associated lipoprotein Pal [Gammaproteobacteria bacterium]|nr:peptidoglycan-associated lipoprotein Pal [Gammaproteobacteria bacterium]
MQFFIKLLLLTVSAVALVGCQSTTPKSAAAVEDRSSAADSGAAASAMDGSGAFRGDALDDPSSPLSRRVIYFDLDSSEVRQEDRATVSAHARYLASTPNAAVAVEGHADERGSREYNLALGERRGNSVRQLLLAEGAATKQLQVVSYGEEKPVAIGHDESAWQQNRRVEIVYTSRR